MAAFQLVQTDDRNVNQLQQSIAQALKPLLSNPATQGLLLPGVSLSSGSTTVNHGLNAKLQGWIIVGQSGLATVYDQQAENTNADKTLALVSSAAVTVTLYVF